MALIEISEITDVINHIDGFSTMVFDLDDTLYSEKQYVRSGYKAVAEILPQVDNAAEKLWTAFESGEPAIDTVLKDEGIYTDELKTRCLETYRSHKPDITLYPGVADMLHEIRKRGLAIGIITDGRPEGQRAKIAALGLEDMVDAVIITDELGGIDYRKPCGKAFHLMRDMLGTADMQLCYVGDNVKKDFKAPSEFGMRCIWFRNKEGLYFV